MWIISPWNTREQKKPAAFEQMCEVKSCHSFNRVSKYCSSENSNIIHFLAYWPICEKKPVKPVTKRASHFPKITFTSKRDTRESRGLEKKKKKKQHNIICILLPWEKLTIGKQPFVYWAPEAPLRPPSLRSRVWPIYKPPSDKVAIEEVSAGEMQEEKEKRERWTLKRHFH